MTIMMQYCSKINNFSIILRQLDKQHTWIKNTIGTIASDIQTFACWTACSDRSISPFVTGRAVVFAYDR